MPNRCNTTLPATSNPGWIATSSAAIDWCNFSWTVRARAHAGLEAALDVTKAVRMSTFFRADPPPPGPPWSWQFTHERSLNTGPRPSPPWLLRSSTTQSCKKILCPRDNCSRCGLLLVFALILSAARESEDVQVQMASETNPNPRSGF